MYASRIKPEDIWLITPEKLCYFLTFTCDKPKYF